MIVLVFPALIIAVIALCVVKLYRQQRHDSLVRQGTEILQDILDERIPDVPYHDPF